MSLTYHGQFPGNLVVLDVALLNHLLGLLDLVLHQVDPLLVDHVLGLQTLDGFVDLIGPYTGLVQVGGGDGALVLRPLELVLQQHQLAVLRLNLTLCKLHRKELFVSTLPKNCVNAKFA